MTDTIYKQTAAVHRVVVTGMGAITPLGNTHEEFWHRIVAGEGAAGPTTHFDVRDLPTTFCCEVREFDPRDWIDKKLARRLDPFCHYALAAASDALSDAGITAENLCDEERDRFGVVFGSGIGGLALIESQMKVYTERGPNRVSPFFIPYMLTNIAAGLIAMDHDLRGPNHCAVSACATGNHNISDAVLQLRHGHADAMLCGGTEYITRLGVAGFCSMKALSTRNDSPQTASRPFDATRDGFVPGEGAGALVLETLEHARERGAMIHAEVLGFGASSDAYHFAAPEPTGRGAARSMLSALEDACIAPDEIDYINMHGTSTPLGDIAETNAVKTVFGEHAYAASLSSTKSMIGHLLGAAGAAEAIATIYAIKNDLVPPTINLNEPDPQCDLDYTPNQARQRSVRIAMSNAFGFGGHNATVIFRRFEE